MTPTSTTKGTSRRGFMASAFAPFLPIMLDVDNADSTTQQEQNREVARLRYGNMPGARRGDLTGYENDPFIVGLEGKLRCMCGCNRSIYHCRTTDFTCTTSPALHREVIRLTEANMSAQEILDAFVLKYGEEVLMAPPKSGFGLAAYVVPGTLITVVGGALLWVLSRRTRIASVVRADEDSPVTDAEVVSSEDRARLEAAIKDLDL